MKKKIKIKGCGRLYFAFNVAIILVVESLETQISILIEAGI